MTKRLVELMGGVIGVESAVGVGSVFWVEVIRAGEPQLAVGATEAAALTPARVRNDAALRSLLYVEDNPANLKLVEQLIARRPNMHLLTAGDAMLGIELARKHQPEVILMDINLPGMSGIGALRILREDPLEGRAPDAWRIVLSGPVTRAMKETMERRIPRAIARGRLDLGRRR